MQENVFSARVLTPNNTSHAAVQVANLTEDTVHLPAETDLETAEVAIVLPNTAPTVTKSLWSKNIGGQTYEPIQSMLTLFRANWV